MAHINAQLGDADHAIPMLKRLLRTSYGGASFLTPATLRLDPLWDKIRNDPRFQELLVEDAPLPEKSIAVLPFENLSKDEENAFFAAGIQDEILTNLAKVADLKVISRTSVMKYKSGLERNLREIANTLGVSHVVEGSVQRAAGRVRVNVQLIDARNDTHLWAEHYDRDVADIFAIQSEIAEQIADQLRAKLSPSEKADIAERPTADLVAYTYYIPKPGRSTSTPITGKARKRTGAKRWNCLKRRCSGIQILPWRIASWRKRTLSSVTTKPNIVSISS